MHRAHVFSLVLGMPLAFVACGGKSDGHDTATESGGHPGAGSGAASASAAGGQGAMSGAGGSGATGAAAGAAGRVATGGGGGSGGSNAGAPNAGRGGASGMGVGGTAGKGASGNGGGAGKPAGGSGGSGPTLLDPPTKAQTWQYTSGDPLNSTPPVLLAVDSDIVLAGASADPTTVGVSAFPSGHTSEAFVLRLSQGKPLWSMPLTAAGLPWAVARSGDDVIIDAPYLPDATQVSTSSVGQAVYLGKFGLDGTKRSEVTVSFDYEWTATYGMAVDGSGNIYLAGSYLDTMGGEHVIVVKCDPNGTKLWEKPFPHPGTQALAFGVAVLTSGDIVVTGDFDVSLSFGGSTETLTVNGDLPTLPTGFIVRLTPDGDPVWSEQFGGADFAIGNAITALGDGGFLLAGSNALDLSLGGLSAQGAPFTATDTQPYAPTAGFIARLDEGGKARWLALDQKTEFAYAVATDGTGTAYLGTNGSVGADDYLHSYDLDTGKPQQALSGSDTSDIQTSSLAVAPSGSVWLSGIYAMGADFGNADVLESTPAGVFLIELAPK